MSEKQTQAALEIEVDPEGSLAPALRANSPLGVAVREYEEQMVRTGYSQNTIVSFANDLKILRTFMDDSAVLREIQTQHLEDFLEWMQSQRGRPCGPKTLSRRITALKAFFAWLHSIGAIGTDPAEPIVQQVVRVPLPEILSSAEVNKIVRCCQDKLWDSNKSDARPYVLLSLLLQTGIKKSETVKVLVEDIERSDTQQPGMFIRYEEERNAHKNRRLKLHANFMGPLEQYLEQYQPENFLFDCTARNLEYVLEEAGSRAGIKRIRVGFETLRWTCAARDFRQGMKDDQLRLKMGLSKFSWRDAHVKIQQLAEKP